MPRRRSLPQPDLLCLRLLQRLYSVEQSTETMKIGVIHSITLLCVYRKLFTTKILFTQVIRALQLPLRFMPIQQKVEVLNFCRMWISSGLNSKEKHKEESRELLKKIFVVGSTLRVKKLKELTEELFLLLHYPFDDTPNIALTEGNVTFEEVLGKSLELRNSGNNYRGALELFKDELH